MSSDTTAAPRANSHGHPCPPWCTENHVTWDTHVSDLFGERARTIVRLKATPVPGFDQTYVSVSSVSGALWLEHGEASRLTNLLEDLAGASADDLRALAEHVRAAVDAL